MTEQQIPQLAGALVTFQRHFAALPTEDAQWAIQNTEAAISLFVEAVKKRRKEGVISPAAPAIIKPVSTIIKPQRPFVPAEIFGDGWMTWLGPEGGNGLEGEEERDPRSFALQELEPSLIEPTIILRRRESYTTSAEQVKRVKAERPEHIRLDPCFSLTLRAEPEKYPDSLKGKATFWDGLTLRSPRGDRCSVCSVWNGGRVVLNAYWRGRSRDADYPSALLASKPLALAA